MGNQTSADQKILLDYNPSNLKKNKTIVVDELKKFYDGEITNLGDIFLVVELDYEKQREKLKENLQNRFQNLKLQDLSNIRLRIQLVSKKNQWLDQSKRQLLQDFKRNEFSFKNNVKHSIKLEELLSQAVELLQTAQKNEKQQAFLKTRIALINNEIGAIQWGKQLDQQKRLQSIKANLTKVLEQLKEKPVVLKSVDKGAQQWLAALQQQQRILPIKQKIKPLLQQIKNLPLKNQQQVAKQNQRIETIRGDLQDVLSDIRKFNVTSLKIVDDMGASDWLKQLQEASLKQEPSTKQLVPDKHQGHPDLQGIAELFESAQTQAQKKQTKKSKEHPQGNQQQKIAISDAKCVRWESSKKHDPFNRTNKGPILNPAKKVFHRVESRCEDKQTFCKKTKSTTLNEKYCKK